MNEAGTQPFHHEAHRPDAEILCWWSKPPTSGKKSTSTLKMLLGNVNTVKQIIIVFGFTILLAALIAFYFMGLPVSQSRTACLAPGMTTNEVIKLLGPPVSIQKLPSETIWVYESPFHFFCVQVFFKWNGEYDRHCKD